MHLQFYICHKKKKPGLMAGLFDKYMCQYYLSKSFEIVFSCMLDVPS